MSKTTEKQHYVPQFYLEKFTHNGKQLFVYDKVLKKSFPSSKADVAQQRYFYDFPPVDKQRLEVSLYKHAATNAFIKSNFDKIREVLLDDQMVEHSLSNMEGLFAQSLRSILHRIDIRKLRNVFRQDLKMDLAFFMAIQIMRTKEFRDTQAEIMEAATYDLLKTEYPKDANNYEVRIDPKTMAFDHADIMFDPELQITIMDILTQHIWMVGINNTKFPFYTSDAPIVKITHKEDPQGKISYAGLGAEGIQIAFPLSPHYILLLYDRNYHRKQHANENKLITLNERLVKRYNCYQVAQSNRQVFCPSSSFELIEEMLIDSPEIFSEKKTRVEIDSDDSFMHFRSTLGNWKPKY